MREYMIGRNVHSGHRFLSCHTDDDNTLTADIDVWPGKPYEVRWRFGPVVASCASAEAAEAAFWLQLVGTRHERKAVPQPRVAQEGKDE